MGPKASSFFRPPVASAARVCAHADNPRPGKHTARGAEEKNDEEDDLGGDRLLRPPAENRLIEAEMGDCDGDRHDDENQTENGHRGG